MQQKHGLWRGEPTGNLKARWINSSPIGRLPQELIQSIFLLCVPLPDRIQSFKPLRLEAPWLLVQVCSLWRYIALSTPELWTTVALREPQDVALSEKWIERAGLFQALSVYYGATHHDIFYDLAKISSQIGRLELCLPDSEDHLKLLLAEPSYDILVELSVTIPKTPRQIHSSDLPYQLSAAPCLRKLTLDLPFILLSSPEQLESLFPWSQLTYLNIRSVHWGIFTDLLSLCVNLKEGRFVVHTPNAMVRVVDDRAVNEYTSLEHLQSLTIHSDHFLRPSIFNGLLLPSLHSLNLENNAEEYPREWNPSAYTGAQHFFAQLRNLENLSISQNPRSLPSILRHTPALKTLSLVTYQSIDNILDALTLRHDDDEVEHDILPRLSKLEFRPKSVYPKTTPSALFKMVTSRSRGKVPAGHTPLEYLDFGTGYLGPGEELGRMVRDALIVL